MRPKFEQIAERPAFVDAMVRFHEPYFSRRATYLSFYVLESGAPLQLQERAASLALVLDNNRLIPPKWRSCLDSATALKRWQSYHSDGLIEMLQNYLGPIPELEEAYQVDASLNWAATEHWWITYEMTFFVASPRRHAPRESSKEKTVAEAVDGMANTTVTVRGLDGSQELVVLPSTGQPVVGDIRTEYARIRGLPLFFLALLREGSTEMLSDTEAVADGDSLMVVLKKARLLILEATRIEDHS